MSLALDLVAAMTMVFGLVPSLVLVRTHVGGDLKAGVRGSSRGTRRLCQGLVIAEVALACALLGSSALLMRTVREMTHVRLGVNGAVVILTSVQLPALVQTASGFLKTVLFGVTPTDVRSTELAALLLLVAALVASLPPAWRAMRVDPVEGLHA